MASVGQMTSLAMSSWSWICLATTPPAFTRSSSFRPLIVATGTSASPAVASSATSGAYARRQAGRTATAISPTAASGTRTTTPCTTSAWTGRPRNVSNIGGSSRQVSTVPPDRQYSPPSRDSRPSSTR